jgi:hypothetical protein
MGARFQSDFLGKEKNGWGAREPGGIVRFRKRWRKGWGIRLDTDQGSMKCKPRRWHRVLDLVRVKIDITDTAVMLVLASAIGRSMQNPHHLRGKENCKRKNNGKILVFHALAPDGGNYHLARKYAKLFFAICLAECHSLHRRIDITFNIRQPYAGMSVMSRTGRAASNSFGS